MTSKNHMSLEMVEAYVRFVYLNEPITLPRDEFEIFRNLFTRRAVYFHQNIRNGAKVWNNIHFLLQLFQVLNEEDKRTIADDIPVELDWLFQICNLWLNMPEYNGFGQDPAQHRSNRFNFTTYIRWVRDGSGDPVYPDNHLVTPIYEKAFNDHKERQNAV